MKVGFIQSAPKFGEVEENLASAVKVVTRLAKDGAELIVLPELFNTGYQFRDKAEARTLSEAVPSGQTTRRLIDLAQDKKLHIVFGIAERSGKKLYNSSVLIGPHGFIATYRKAHPFWNEKKIFSPGNTPFKVYDIGKARVGMMICFDWIFPEVARRLSLLGADIICHPSNLVLPHCPEAMITRSLENRVFTITANRVGTESRGRGGRLSFIGQSQIVSPRGELLARAPRGRVFSKVVQVDIKKARYKKITPVNDLFLDRREDMY
jgi:predicted amidohydrolase